MKRFLSNLLFLMLAITCNAQGWTKTTLEADELLGEKGGIAYSFCNEENTMKFICWEGNTESFRVISSTKLFDYGSNLGANGHKIFLGLIGFYDENDSLIEKIEKFCFELDDEGLSNQAHPNRWTSMGGNNKKNVRKMFDYLKNKKGYIRIVAPLYGTNSNFDLKIPCCNLDEL